VLVVVVELGEEGFDEGQLLSCLLRVLKSFQELD
jgi:hypothetical protein